MEHREANCWMHVWMKLAAGEFNHKTKLKIQWFLWSCWMQWTFCGIWWNLLCIRDVSTAMGGACNYYSLRPLLPDYNYYIIIVFIPHHTGSLPLLPAARVGPPTSTSACGKPAACVIIRLLYPPILSNKYILSLAFFCWCCLRWPLVETEYVY